MVRTLSGGFRRAPTVFFLVGLFGFLHLVDGILHVLLQPLELRVHTHLFIALQLGNHLEGAVRCVDELELSDESPWEGVDG